MGNRAKRAAALREEEKLYRKNFEKQMLNRHCPYCKANYTRYSVIWSNGWISGYVQGLEDLGDKKDVVLFILSVSSVDK